MAWFSRKDQTNVGEAFVSRTESRYSIVRPR
jgi:hypothetical protein